VRCLLWGILLLGAWGLLGEKSELATICDCVSVGSAFVLLRRT
jgi:hypothetical protein